MVSILLASLGFLLEAISVYIDEGYAASFGYSPSTSDLIWIALASMLLVISLFALVSSISVRRGAYPSRMILGILLLAAISLILEGAGMFAYTTSGPNWWGASAVLAIVAGVILLMARFTSMGISKGMRLTGAIFAIAFAALLIARDFSLSAFSFYSVVNNGSSLNSLLPLSFSVRSYGSLFYAAPLLVPLGIIGFTYLTYIAFLLVALGLLFRAHLHAAGLMPIAWIIALVGFLLYGIDLAWGNISVLYNFPYGLADWTTAALPVISAVILSICAFAIMATSVVGMAFYSGGLVRPSMSQPALQ